VTIDRDDFVEVMTSFPSGVAVITTIDSAGAPWGLTTNALSSVSADPPMLLVCVAKTSRSLPALLERKGFLVNFMGVGSEETCSRFASKAPAAEKFRTTAWELSPGGHPRLTEDSVAYADCSTDREIEAGSHLILVGKVTGGAVTAPDREPIAYFKRAFRGWGS
jgi:flavin reductase (NADH)